jgi:histidine triad (HIT) family protein
MNDDCIFCKIVRGDVSASEEHRDANVLAFHDLNPQAPHHLLVIPTMHATHLSDFVQHGKPEVAVQLLAIASKLGAKFGDGKGYRIVANEGASAGQTVFHLHLHVLAGRRFAWPPG